MNKKWMIASAFVFAGLSLAAYRSRSVDAPANNPVILEDNKMRSPHQELAQWLIREGRLDIRGRRIRAARHLAALAKILDENSGHEVLAKTVLERQK